MTDLSHLSDEELERVFAQEKQRRAEAALNAESEERLCEIRLTITTADPTRLIEDLRAYGYAPRNVVNLIDLSPVTRAYENERRSAEQAIAELESFIDDTALPQDVAERAFRAYRECKLLKEQRIPGFAELHDRIYQHLL